MTKNLILVCSEIHKWVIPAHFIAHHRAEHYAELDPDTTYQEEYDFTIGDPDELQDWFFNNMNWEDVEKVAYIIVSAPPTTPDLRNLLDTYVEEVK